MEIRLIRQDEFPQALALVERVFMEFEAPEYEPKGVETFLAFIRDPEKNNQLTFHGAFDGDTVIGVIAICDKSHISLFFVDAVWQNRGVGRALFAAARKALGADAITVNSSPYAVEIYRKLGFLPLGPEQIIDGIRFTPMRSIHVSESSE